MRRKGLRGWVAAAGCWWLVGCLFFLAGCQGPMNSVQRARWTLTEQAASAERDAAQERIQSAQIAAAELRRAARAAERERERQRGITERQSTELGAELATLRAIEEDLVAAKQQQARSKGELDRLAAAEARVAKLAEELARLGAEEKALGQKLVAARAALAKRRTAVDQALVALQPELDQLGKALPILQQLVAARLAAKKPPAKKAPPKK